MKKRILLRLQDHEMRHLASLEWRARTTTVLHVVPELAKDVERWMQRGLIEWIGPRDALSQRVTPSSSEHFLPRLRDYLELQFALSTHLRDQHTPT